MKLARTFCSLAIVGSLVTACGNDDEPASNEYSEAVAESLRTGEDRLPFSDSEIDCLSVQFVDAIGGPAALEEAGIEPEQLETAESPSELGLDLGEDDAERFAESFNNCDISLAQLILAEASDEVPAEVRDCIQDNVDEELLADFFARVLLNEADENQPPEALLQSLGQCISG